MLLLIESPSHDAHRLDDIAEPMPMMMPSMVSSARILLAAQAGDGKGHIFQELCHDTHSSRLQALCVRTRQRVTAPLPVKAVRQRTPLPGRTSTTWPSRMVTTRWVSSASSRLWVMSTMVLPCSRCSRVEEVHHQPSGVRSRARRSARRPAGWPGRWPLPGRWRRAASVRRKARWAWWLMRSVHPHHAQAAPWRGAARLRARHACIEHRQLDIFERRGAGDQVEGLEHKPDLFVADCRELCRHWHPADRARRPADSSPFGGAVQRADDIHQGGLCPSRTAPTIETNSPSSHHKVDALAGWSSSLGWPI